MPLSPSYSKFLKVVDNSMAESIGKVAEKGLKVPCAKGCAHCCQLMVEVTWDEAQELGNWILEQPAEKRDRLRKKVKLAARDRRKFFAKRSSTKHFLKPTTSTREATAKVCDDYFFEKSRVCPLLENGVCSVYPARPSACRLHLVTNHPSLCSRDTNDSSGINVPKQVDSARKKIEVHAAKALPDRRWGELSIVLDQVFAEKQTVTISSLVESRLSKRAPRI